MSFQKRTRQLPIVGTKPSLHNGQLLTSTGNPSLDYILGGGQQLGTLLLIEEDKSGCYASTLTKYYLAEGILQKHSLFVASLDDDPQAIIEKLPAPVAEVENTSNPPISTNPDDDMRIAWRYNNLPKVDSVEESKKSNFEHFFDLSKTLDEETIRQVEITTWNGTKFAPSSYIKNPQMQDCLRKLHEIAQKYPLEKSSKLLRVVVQSFASPYWYTSSFVPDLIKFLYTLKSILRQTTATCLITIPSHLLKHVDADLVTKTRSSVDYAIELESFAGSERETNPIFKDYHGLLNIKRIQAVNSPAAYHPKIKDLAFKLRRKKFVIEKLHLPPELQESAEREQDDIVPGGVGCSSAKGKKLLDF